MKAEKPKNHSSEDMDGTDAPAESAEDQTEASANEVVEKLRMEAREFRELALRKQAELENYRKRMIREKEEAIRYANASLLEKLLPVLDSFELGLQAAESSSDAGAIAKGFEMVHRQIQDFLKDSGVEVVDALGAPFDPNFHDAASQIHEPGVPEGHVAHQIRKGYKLKDRLLRPSTVVVSLGEPSKQAGAEPADREG